MTKDCCVSFRPREIFSLNPFAEHSDDLEGSYGRGIGFCQLV